jgi:hypothetical protein
VKPIPARSGRWNELDTALQHLIEARRFTPAGFLIRGAGPPAFALTEPTAPVVHLKSSWVIRLTPDPTLIAFSKGEETQ